MLMFKNKDSSCSPLQKLIAWLQKHHSTHFAMCAINEIASGSTKLCNSQSRFTSKPQFSLMLKKIKYSKLKTEMKILVYIINFSMTLALTAVFFPNSSANYLFLIMFCQISFRNYFYSFIPIFSHVCMYRHI